MGCLHKLQINYLTTSPQETMTFYRPRQCHSKELHPLFLVWFWLLVLDLNTDSSQEAGKVVWYSHLFKNFLQFIVIHATKGFNIVNKGEIDIFLEFSCFFSDPMDAGNLISGSLSFLKLAWTSRSSQFTYYWSLAWRILSNTAVCSYLKIKQFFKTAWNRLVSIHVRQSDLVFHCFFFN